MLIKSLNPALLLKLKNKLLYFTKKYGERRITSDAIHWLEQKACDELSKPGTEVLIALEHTRLIGLSGVANFGKDTAFIVVHPEHRGKQLGQKLICTHIEQLGQFNCNVAADNLPSLRMCFKAGLVATDLFAGIKGKPTLRMIGGNPHCPVPHLEL